MSSSSGSYVLTALGGISLIAGTDQDPEPGARLIGLPRTGVLRSARLSALPRVCA
ncbi:hypothetical protein [Streptacidiphilus anmyonensis]|uniref:hypothetical protein n=1 Tax=Streptacidiphilus anmyonensis TaxID=405782 RepID=UPI000B0FDE40|nr:hypothetical protein [Streptacidiphilus anmyonensis]